MKKYLVFLTVFCMMSIPQIAKAGQTPDLFASPQLLSGAIIAPVATMHNMLGDRFIIELMPAYWTASFDGGDTTGYGGALALKYEFSAQWGIALLGSYGSSEEFSATKSILGVQQTDFISGKHKLDNSQTLALALTHDFFPQPDGFRLPVFVGVMSGTAKLSGSEQGTNDTVTVTNEVTDLNWAFGISPEFNVWLFRFQPAVVIMNSEGSTITWKHQDGRTESKKGSGEFTGGLLLGIKYEPFGLTYTFQSTPGVDNLTIHSFVFTKVW